MSQNDTRTRWPELRGETIDALAEIDAVERAREEHSASIVRTCGTGCEMPCVLEVFLNGCARCVREDMI